MLKSIQLHKFYRVKNWWAVLIIFYDTIKFWGGELFPTISPPEFNTGWKVHRSCVSLSLYHVRYSKWTEQHLWFIYKGHSKESIALKFIKKNRLWYILMKLHHFKLTEMYITGVYYIVLTVEYSVHTIYCPFTRTHKRIWLQKELNNNWVIETQEQ